jgi:hypothetical protein
MFANELLRHYQAANRSIVYENQEQRHRWLLPPNGPIWEGGLDAFAEELKQAATVYICDCGKDVYRNPAVCNARTIVLSSPNRKHYEGWLSEQRSILRVFLPLWSLDETRAAVPSVFPARQAVQRDADGLPVLAAGLPVQVDLYEQRFHIYGGSARFVFSPDDDDKAMESLKGRIQSCDLKSLVATATADLKSALPIEDITWRFVRIDVEESDAAGTPKFENVQLDFISDHILRRLVARKERDHQTQLVELLREAGAPVPQDTSSLRGKVFERYAINTLSAGGVFRARWLNDAAHADMWLAFPATSQKGILGSLNNLQQGVRSAHAVEGTRRCCESLCFPLSSPSIFLSRCVRTGDRSTAAGELSDHRQCDSSTASAPPPDDHFQDAFHQSPRAAQLHAATQRAACSELCSALLRGAAGCLSCVRQSDSGPRWGSSRAAEQRTHARAGDVAATVRRRQTQGQSDEHARRPADRHASSVSRAHDMVCARGLSCFVFRRTPPLLVSALTLFSPLRQLSLRAPATQTSSAVPLSRQRRSAAIALV